MNTNHFSTSCLTGVEEKNVIIGDDIGDWLLGNDDRMFGGTLHELQACVFSFWSNSRTHGSFQKMNEKTNLQDLPGFGW